ncbi:hypothetical protein CO178_02170 [candidate division WWE3 bacterium CG_4_9_14_3_um_filter_34_6]|uniref:Type 4a pilus biogenesis protein PilO n=1 Tax=candidate division WWE3 bacterium CG_4_9_14_3_um_filter_34_6 TaxID=1975079 RepID=A0A2M7X2M7_UNCKA|nr:MAG: hypothetical protein CO178_02170 [candidate division WWE3 bacterium CG_4_9_14_3_um_filter_34_6]
MANITPNIENKTKYKITTKVHEYVYLVVTLGAISFFIAFLIRPSIISVLELRKEAKEYSTLDKVLSEKVNNLDSIKLQREEIKDLLSLLDKAVPTSSNESDLLLSINQSASKDNMQLTSINFSYPTETENNGDLKNITITMQAAGTYENILLFLSSLKNLLRSVLISSIKIEPYEKLGTNVLLISIEAKSYYISK